jgi:molecular chaperone GrpE (heat shock protein)
MFHEAVVHVDDPMVGEGIIVEEFQAGYMYNGQVLRFSKVKVAN